MTIRAKLYAAIVMAVLGPLVTIGVALSSTSRMTDQFDEVQATMLRETLALQLKYDVTDFNGWQTAYGYDNGRSRPRFQASVDIFRHDLARADRLLADRRERELLARLQRRYDSFMRLDAVAYRNLRDGNEGRVKAIFLGPEIRNFENMAATAQGLASYQHARAAEARRSFNDVTSDSRRELIAVAIGTGVLIVLLLVTAQDIARAALESRSRAPRAPPPPGAA